MLLAQNKGLYYEVISLFQYAIIFFMYLRWSRSCVIVCESDTIYLENGLTDCNTVFWESFFMVFIWVLLPLEYADIDLESGGGGVCSGSGMEAAICLFLSSSSSISLRLWTRSLRCGGGRNLSWWRFSEGVLVWSVFSIFERRSFTSASSCSKSYRPLGGINRALVEGVGVCVNGLFFFSFFLDADYAPKGKDVPPGGRRLYSRWLSRLMRARALSNWRYG